MTKAQIKEGETFVYYPDGYTKTTLSEGDTLEGAFADTAITLKKATKYAKKKDAPENKDAGGAKEEK